MKKILVVDDNKNFAQSLRIGLRREGYSVDIVSDAMDAIQRLIFKDYDVLLTDLRMPKMNGIELANMASEVDPAMKIVLISAYDFKDYENQFMQYHNYSRLSKPFQMPDLLSELDEEKVPAAMPQKSSQHVLAS